jgi:hypothetical protein
MIKLGQRLSKSTARYPDVTVTHAAPVYGHERAVRPVLALDRLLARIQTGDPRCTQTTRVPNFQQLKWASARLGFYAYVGFSMVTVVGGFLTAPLVTWLFFNDWRFWRHWGRAWQLFPHAWFIAWQMLKRESRFMLSVPLTSAPQTGPDHSRVELAPAWEHGTSCGDCQRCCEVLSLRCPVLDETSGFCTGYNSFYWRYFNCGRYPTRSAEIKYYGCDKWRMMVIPIDSITGRR